MSCASSVSSVTTAGTSDVPLEGQETSINGTCFDMEACVLPHTFCIRRKKNYNRVKRVVVRIVVVKINVRARTRTPEGITFVPLFVTNDDLLLEPETCDVVGNCSGGDCNLNPSFVLKYETSPKRVKATSIEFDLRPEDMDSFQIDLDLPESETYSEPVARKAAHKQFSTFNPIKRPRKAYYTRPGSPSPSEQESEGEDTKEVRVGSSNASTPESPLDLS